MFVVPRGSRGRADGRGHGSGWCIALMRMVLIDNLHFERCCARRLWEVSAQLLRWRPPIDPADPV